ncbi:hypothetical protein ACROSR_07080 [Roseovarius tibetensis]|uniref:hypothetical protein n=1 Tax=Roseovarius tibetensis TaxID=2685897 RepID=UPI003D7F887B
MQTSYRHTPARPGARTGRLVIMGAVATIVALSGDASGAQDADTGPTLAVELNKLEQTGAACRSYMVLSNRTETPLDTLSLDLVVFDTDGVIERRLAVALGPLDAGRTQVKAFDMAELDCDIVGRVLLNEVLTCSPDRVDPTTTCDAALQVSGRGNVDFIR